MLMFASILLASLVVLAICAAIMSTVEPGASPQPEVQIATAPSRFFGGDIAPAQGTMPADLLLSQIQAHVQLEQAAAERFVNVPTSDSLHAPTPSPFVN